MLFFARQSGMIGIPSAGVGQVRESDRLEHNPYSPPASAALMAAPSELAPRPFAVWLLLLVLSFLTLAGVVGLARFFWTVASHGFEVRDPHSPAANAWRLAWVAVGSFAIVSAYRRGRLGRWLGVAAIAVLTVWAVLRPQHSQSPDQAYNFGALIGQYFISPLLCAWWAYAFGFSSKAKRYFLQAIPR
jgi:hypothetical protein